MNDTLKQELKEKLLAEKENTIEELSTVAKPDTGDHVAGNYKANLPDYGDDTGDDPESSPAEVEEYELNTAVTNNLETRLNQIDAALEKIENGEYGICENCNQEIPEDRLKVNPAALTCVKCE